MKRASLQETFPDRAAGPRRARRDAAPHDRAARSRRARRSTGRRAALPIVALLAVLASTAVFAIPASGAANPVLGAKGFALPSGEGFGTPEPATIFNGGDPSGLVTKVHWTGWGNPTALGYGLNPIFKPGGGYYRKPARIELRATSLGKCGNQRAYTKLEARLPKHPGGKLGKWFSWSGAKTICKPPY